MKSLPYLVMGVALKLIWDEYVQPISNKGFYATKLDAWTNKTWKLTLSPAITKNKSTMMNAPKN